MFRFANENYLYLLILIPFLFALFFYASYRRRKALRVFGDKEMISLLMPSVSRYKPGIKFGCWITSFIILIFVLARPQLVLKKETEKTKGIEVMIAVDVSNSMLAEDPVYRPFNRIEKAKQELSRLIDKLGNDRVGLIVFAGIPYIQLPITSDNVSAKMFFSSISTDMVGVQGTAIGEAINLCVSSFGPDKEIERAIVIITDGENHEDDAVSAAKKAYNDFGIKVHVLGIGDPKGVPIPIKGTNGFRKDKEGNIIVTRLNEDMCKQIAQAGKGMYAHIDNTNAANRYLFKELDNMSKTELEKKTYADFDEQYQYLLLIAIIFLFVEGFMLEKKNKYLSRMNFFSTESKKGGE